jgi:hypothetical protein
MKKQNSILKNQYPKIINKLYLIAGLVIAIKKQDKCSKQ